MLEDPVLDLFEVVVVLVEDLAGASDVDVAAGHAVPRQVADPLEPRPDQAVLRARLGNGREPVQLALRLAARLGRRTGLLDAVAQRVQLRPFFLLAQLALDRPQLFAQDRLALRFREPFLRSLGDALPELADGDLVLQQLDEMAELGVDRLQLQDLLARREVERHRARDRIRDFERVLQRFRGADHLRRQPEQRHELAQEIEDGAAQGLDLDVDAGPIRLARDPRDEIRIRGDDFNDPDPLDALERDPNAAVRRPQQLHDGRRGSDLVEVLARGLFDLRVPLRDRQHQPVRAHRIVDDAERLGRPTLCGATIEG